MSGNLSLNWRLIAGAIAGGAFYGLSFPPSPFGYLALVAWLPALEAWRGAHTLRGAYMVGLLFHLSCFSIAFSWPLAHALPSVAIASIVPLVLLTVLLGLPFVFSHLVRMRLGIGVGLLALVTSHLLVEAVLQRGPLAMPWPLAGNALANAVPVHMLAAIGGVSLLSLWVLAINVLAFQALRMSGVRRAWPAASALLLIAGGWFGGNAASIDQSDLKTVRVTLVQPVMTPHDWADVESRGRLETLVEMTDSLHEQSGPSWLTVWPETALPPCRGSLLCDDVLDTLRAAVARSGTPLLSGAIAADAPEPGAVWRNSLVLVDREAPPHRYDKIRLVPFAEGVPFEHRFPSLAALAVDAGGVASYQAGRERILLEVDGIQIGPMICFESVFPQDAAAYARDGADVLIVASQDGWWGDSFGHRQHLAFTRLRAIETRRTVVFVAASGTSAVIGPDGGTTASIPFGTRRAIQAEVPLASGNTPFVRYGDLVAPGAAMVAFLLLGVCLISRDRRRIHPASAKI